MASAEHHPDHALHEAGHAVAAYRLGFVVGFVSAAPNAAGHAETGVAGVLPGRHAHPRSRRAFWRRVIMMHTGGMVAEELLSPDWSAADPRDEQSLTWVSDLIDMFVNVEKFCLDSALHLTADARLAFIAECWDSTRTLLSRPANARAIERLAGELREQDALTGPQARAIIRSMAHSRRRVPLNRDAPTLERRRAMLAHAKHNIDRILAQSAVRPDEEMTISLERGSRTMDVRLSADYLTMVRTLWWATPVEQ